MPSYRRGSKGPEVAKIQTKLRGLDLYRGPIDASFGGGTEAAVRAFQQARGLAVDGIVGPATWKSLFRVAIVTPEIADQPLNQRCMALTGTFETDAPIPECFAGLSGDFDGQGISFGVLQWNIGQRSLQPLLARMDEEHPELVDELFNRNASVLRAMLSSNKSEQLDWARSIQDPLRRTVSEPWRGQFKSLGRREEFQSLQVEAAGEPFATARRWCIEYGVRSQRALALMFDIRTQNGSISAIVKGQILADFARLPGDQNGQTEVLKLCAIANRRAEASNPRWVEDVRRRKLTIAKGIGTVHGNHIDLEGQFGITLADAIAVETQPAGARVARVKAFASGGTQRRGRTRSARAVGVR